MCACPNCGAHSISFIRKWLSWSAAPARCNSCGSASAIPIVDASGVLVAAVLVITAGGFLAAAVGSIYPVLLTVVLAVGYYFWRQHRAPLMVITPEESRVAKRSARLSLLVLLFPGFFS